AATAIFWLRFDEFDKLFFNTMPVKSRSPDNGFIVEDRLEGRATFNIRRSPTPQGKDKGVKVMQYISSKRENEPPWRLIIKHRAGSLDAAVTNVRRRNLFISFGILLLLAASMVMIFISTRRAQRLAKQQMEFVAGVSHELRTPLAVICSAG